VERRKRSKKGRGGEKLSKVGEAGGFDLVFWVSEGHRGEGKKALLKKKKKRDGEIRGKVTRKAYR